MDSPDNSEIATLPARESLIPFISSSFCDPDKMNNPRSSESSTIFLISSNISLSFWTSSIKSGQGLFRKKSFGSYLACSLVSLSSKFALLYSVNSCLISVDFPTCLAPIIREHLLDATLFFSTDVIALSI